MGDIEMKLLPWIGKKYFSPDLPDGAQQAYPIFKFANVSFWLIWVYGFIYPLGCYLIVGIMSTHHGAVWVSLKEFISSVFSNPNAFFNTFYLGTIYVSFLLIVGHFKIKPIQYEKGLIAKVRKLNLAILFALLLFSVLMICAAQNAEFEEFGFMALVFGVAVSFIFIIGFIFLFAGYHHYYFAPYIVRKSLQIRFKTERNLGSGFEENSGSNEKN
jgi:hypothetical protein